MKTITIFKGMILVDDTRLELVTSRTSSGCATSCANRPHSESYSNLNDRGCQQLLLIFPRNSDAFRPICFVSKESGWRNQISDIIDTVSGDEKPKPPEKEQLGEVFHEDIRDSGTCLRR